MKNISTRERAGAGAVGTPVETSTGLLAWYHEATLPERRAFWASFGGWTLDAMDVNLYSFVIPTLIAAWALTRTEAGMLATVTLLISAVGGWIAGIAADRIGRVRLLQITVLWFAVFTLLSGFTQSFTQLLIVRGLHGLGFGGEWAVGAVLMGEIIRDEHRGKAVGTVHSGWAVGWGLAALLYTVLFSLLPPAIAWRALFFVGAAPALFVLYLRKYVEEPPLFVAARSSKQPKQRGAVLGIFAPGTLWVTLFASLLAVGTQGGYYAVMIWLPTYLKTVRHLSVLNTGGYLAVVIVASFIGYVASGYLADRLGRRKNFILFSVCSVATVLAYMFYPVGDGVMLVLGFPLGFFASGTYSGIGAFFAELYPTAIRGSGIGFCFNFGRAIGAIFPTLVGALSSTISLAHAIGLFTIAAYALIIVSALLLPETKGRRLTA